MKLSLDIIESNAEIMNKIIQSLLPEVNVYMKQRLSSIRSELPILLKTAIINTSEYESIRGGQLQYEFGIANPQDALNEILDIWTNNLNIEYKQPTMSNNKIKASFSVSLIKSDFSDVLSTGSSLVIDNLRGYNLPWLEWLLLEGNKTIVSNQEVIVGPNKFSRTGLAVMRGSNKSWKVPSQFSGTIGDNWITRTIDSIEGDINNLIQRILDQ